MSGACPFDLCDGSGFRHDAETNTDYDCQCRPQRVAQAKASNLSAVIPRLYRDASFDRPPVTDIEDSGVVDKVRSFAGRIENHLDAGRGLWLLGPPGTGKTTLAMLVSKSALAAGRTVAIYSLPRLLNAIRDTYTDGSYTHMFDRLATVDLLHVDDVGAERKTDWVMEELYSIVNARYEDKRSMLITTNIEDREQLCDQIGPRTVSRLTEMCDDLPVTGFDRRMIPHPVSA